MTARITALLLALTTTLAVVVTPAAQAEEMDVPKAAKSSPSQAAETDVQSLLDQVILGNQEATEQAAAMLRARGPRAMDTLFAYRADLADRIARTRCRFFNPDPSELVLLDKLIDRVAGQRYASVSRLYWYTDLDEARAAAAESGKPILSLRMLGRLTDEYSCANSRFFRTTVYANAAVAERLRENFVLHWRSVRPVPRVTIDFGDGRTLERTVTGNSCHYVLATDGQPLDALPGLHGPQAFLDWLDAAETYHDAFGSLTPELRAERLVKLHSLRAQNSNDSWTRDVAFTTPKPAVDQQEAPARGALARGNTRIAVEPAPAAEATKLTVSKGRVEVPVLRLVGEQSPFPAPESADDDVWRRVAAMPTHAVELDEASIALIAREQAGIATPEGYVAAGLEHDDSLATTVRALEESIALDTVRNEYTMHIVVHGWFAAGEVTPDVEELNERVYSALFLTPSSDPWLGLSPADTYTALERGGKTDPAR